MKIVFLDIDGVLVTSDSMRNRYQWPRQQVNNLYKILLVTGAKIVVSSTWRWEHDWKELLKIFESNGIPRYFLYGSTPIISFSERAEEIKSWLRAAANIDRYVIIDDDIFAGKDMEGKFVCTKPGKGLTEENAKAAIEILNK